MEPFSGKQISTDFSMRRWEEQDEETRREKWRFSSTARRKIAVRDHERTFSVFF